MSSFLFRALLFAIPSLTIIISVVCLDFFKVYGFQDYYADQKVGLNREMVTTKTYNHHREKARFNSFIFGSSRSQAFKCKEWKTYLGSNAKPFHFDASGESIWGISKKVRYIDELGDTIKNAFVVLDRTILKGVQPKKGHLFISHPSISKASFFGYYFTFLKASLNLKFLVANIDYSIFKTYRNYMGYLIKRGKWNHTADALTCDIWYGYDKEIKADSLNYYNRLIKQGVFFERPIDSRTDCPITSEEKEFLNDIKSIFTKHNTKYKIIISPVYNQIPMEQEQVKLLEQVFGKENVYNFSGKNRFTEPIYNFYESSHFKPHVADEIIKISYN